MRNPLPHFTFTATDYRTRATSIARPYNPARALSHVIQPGACCEVDPRLAGYPLTKRRPRTNVTNLAHLASSTHSGKGNVCSSSQSPPNYPPHPHTTSHHLTPPHTIHKNFKTIADYLKNPFTRENQCVTLTRMDTNHKALSAASEYYAVSPFITVTPKPQNTKHKARGTKHEARSPKPCPYTMKTITKMRPAKVTRKRYNTVR